MSNKNNDNVFEYILEHLSEEEIKDVYFHRIAGLTFAGINEDLELQWLGNDKEWQEYNKLIYKVSSDDIIPF